MEYEYDREAFLEECASRGNDMNPNAYEGMPLHELLDEAANFVEVHICDHSEDYEGPDDSLFERDDLLAKLLRHAANTLRCVNMGDSDNG